MYVDILETFNLKQHVKQPTRKSKSLIDHIVSNLEAKLITGDVIECDEISDHDAPFCIFKLTKERYEPRFKYLRNEKTLVMNDYIDDFRQLPLNIVYAFDNVSDKVNILNKLITDCIDRHAPIRRVKITRPSSPWMKDLRISDLQRKRNRLRKLQKNEPSEENLKDLRNIRNELKNSIKVTKRISF